jgi:hypothetical protein
MDWLGDFESLRGELRGMGAGSAAVARQPSELLRCHSLLSDLPELQLQCRELLIAKQNLVDQVRTEFLAQVGLHYVGQLAAAYSRRTESRL